MVSNTHYIELYINGGLMELKSQESLHLRINNVLFNPTKTSTKQAEYSYSFEIPSTPSNDRILNYANNLSKTNKFHTRYSAQVYSDGTIIFDGSLTIQKYDAKDKMYTCNLVNIKINTLDDIFGDDVLTDAKWLIDFNGVDTMNAINNDFNSKYYFPLISYGAFYKNWVSKDEVDAEYTSKYLIDNYNQWWISDFYPSLNVLEEIKKCFEWKGYTVGGTALSDPILNNIYASTNLADEQHPTYNLGNPKFGKLDITVDWTNTTDLGGQEDENMIIQDLKFPYMKVEGLDDSDEQVQKTKFNYDKINVWSVMNLDNMNITLNEPSAFMTINNIGTSSNVGNFIRIPKSGWYKIEMSGYTESIIKPGTSGTPLDCTIFAFDEWQKTVAAGGTATPGKLKLSKRARRYANITEFAPIDFYLVKNYHPDDNPIELIKGAKNKRYKNGAQVDEWNSNYQAGQHNVSVKVPNAVTWESCFPHEALYNADNPSSNGKFTNVGATSDNVQGYIKNSGSTSVMAYDPAVSEAFICGYSTFLDNTIAIAKNGKSWNKASSGTNKVFANIDGYRYVTKQYDASGNVISYNSTPTNFNRNEYLYAPTCNMSVSGTSATCYINCCVWLEEGDSLEMLAIARSYDYGYHYYYFNGEYHYLEDLEGGKDFAREKLYNFWGKTRLKIEAISSINMNEMKALNFNYNTPTMYDDKLNLFEFTNKEKKISDWIKNIQDAFNLSIEVQGNTVEINSQKGIKKTITNAIDIDDRVSSYDAESEYISYPRTMAIKYKIDTDEWGFRESVPQEHKDDIDWKKWGESGFTIIQLNDDSYEKSSQNKSLQFSYTWYDNFSYRGNFDLNIPVIEKNEYMIDGFNYEDAMAHRGYKLAQRFWFRNQNVLSVGVPISNDVYYASEFSPHYSGKTMYICTPINQQNGINLSYRDNEVSLVTEYFNIYPMLSSNYVNIEAFLNPIEYIQIKDGALVHFDSDLYYTSEISGYDPSGANPTKLKLIKKT